MLRSLKPASAAQEVSVPQANKSLKKMVEKRKIVKVEKISVVEYLWMKFHNGAQICTDSRQITPGCIFFALKGETFDGNKFALSALEKGAAIAVVDNKVAAMAGTGKEQDETPENGRRKARKVRIQNCRKDELMPLQWKGGMLLVESVLGCLQQLARYNRLKYRIPVIALTGTNGKTTTKELITAVLSTEFNVVATQGNLNNHLGVPYTLLRINEQTQIAVVEMGASAPGEIKTLVELACPTFGLITNVGTAHLQGFGSKEAIIATKGELYDNLVSYHKMAFVNVDNPLLMDMAHKRDLKIIPYGVQNNGAHILHKKGNPYLNMTVPSPEMDSGVSRHRIHTHLIGDYNADNVMAAITVGTYFGIKGKKAIKAIEQYCPLNNRSQLKVTDRNTLIIDAYNANPSSMLVSLANFKKLSFEHKVLILGDMRELGTESVSEHVAILRQALALGCEKVILVGAEFNKALDSLCSMGGSRCKEAEGQCRPDDSGCGEIYIYKDAAELAQVLERKALKGCTVLIKGSHGIHLETLIDLL